MEVVELREKSVSALLAIIERMPGNYGHVFRGQANADWGLIPSLYRVEHIAIMGGTFEENYDMFEAEWVRRFFDDGLPYLPPLPRSYSNDRILAQHFGVPTRLMDWSRDPLVAAFFATEDCSEADAAIFMILPEARHKPEDVRSLGAHQTIAMTPPAIDRRIPAQKSVFTFHPYGDAHEPFEPLDQRPDMGCRITTENGVERGFAKIVIPAGMKRKLHTTLWSLGYDRRNLFPGLDGVGAAIGARARAGGMPD